MRSSETALHACRLQNARAETGTSRNSHTIVRYYFVWKIYQMFYFLFAPNFLSCKHSTVVATATRAAIRQKQNSCIFFGRTPEYWSLSRCTLKHRFERRQISSIVISELKSATAPGVFLGSNATETLGSLPQICALIHYCLCALEAVILTSWLDLICSTKRMIVSHCVYLPIYD